MWETKVKLFSLLLFFTYFRTSLVRLVSSGRSLQYLVQRAAPYHPDLVRLLCQLRVDQPEGRAEVWCQVVCSCRGRSGGQQVQSPQ